MTNTPLKVHGVRLSREEAWVFIHNQIDAQGDCKVEERHLNKDSYHSLSSFGFPQSKPFHYGKCELKDLVDALYGPYVDKRKSGSMMIKNLVKELREPMETERKFENHYNSERREAADLIEQLQADVEYRLRVSELKFVKGYDDDDNDHD